MNSFEERQRSTGPGAVCTTRERRRDEILEEALSMDRAELERFLDRACSGDTSFRLEIERLLRVHDHMNTWSLGRRVEAENKPSFETGRLLGRYEIQAVHGYGGMGIVYRARDSVIGRTVAVKVLAGSSASGPDHERLLSELRIMGSVVHDNIVRVYDYGEIEGAPYIVMEFLEGEDLAKAMAGGRCGDLARKLEIARQIAAALQHIHTAGIVHRDVKPANVYLEASGRIKLMDFGIALADASLLASGEIAGTPQYMAPEQLKGASGGPAVDIYAFGIVLFELLTGERAFRGSTREELFRSILVDDLPLEVVISSGAPRQIVDLIRGATNKDAASRPQSFTEVIEVLESARLPRRSLPKRAISVAVGVLALSLIAMLALPRFQAPTAPAPLEARQNDKPTRSAPIPAAESLRATEPVRKTVDPPPQRKPLADAEQIAPSQPVASREEVANAGQAQTPAPIVTAPPIQTETPSSEDAEWERLKSSTDAAAIDAFRRSYPSGKFAEQARQISERLAWEHLRDSEDSHALRAFAATYPGGALGTRASRLADEFDARRNSKREILSLLTRYAAANRNRNLQEIAAIWPGLGPERLRLIGHSFTAAEKIEFDLEPEGEPEFSEPAAASAYASASYQGAAVIACRRRVRMIDRSGVRPQPVESRVHIRLARIEGTWRIVSID